MRAHATVRAFASRARTSLLVVPLGHGDDGVLPPELAELPHVVVPPSGQRLRPLLLRGLVEVGERLAGRGLAMSGEGAALGTLLGAVLGDAVLEQRLLSRRRLAAAARAFPGQRFDRVHTFRLYAAPIAHAFRQTHRGGRYSLDIDDRESVKAARLAQVKAGSDPIGAAAARPAAAAWRSQERRWLDRFDQLAVCSAEDRRALEADVAAPIFVAPNVYAVQEYAEPPPGRVRLLFVGALRYAPNSDGLTWFVRQVAPRIAQARPGQWELEIVGRGGAAALPADVAGADCIVRVAELPSVVPAYRRAHVCVAPIRAGGGTRIKILEAFAHGRPVVATGIGAEGIQARPEEELMIADDAEAFAEACVRLIDDAELRGAVGLGGRAFLERHHGLERLADGLLGEPTAGGSWGAP